MAQNKEKTLPRHKFYKSRWNGLVYPAMSNPSGMEDQNTEDWEPASEQEIAAYHAKNKADIQRQTGIALREQAQETEYAQRNVPPRPATGASITSITLAPDENGDGLPEVTVTTTAGDITPAPSALGGIAPAPKQE